MKDGEFVAIMGQNGAGKTTLVKHFNGLLKPTKGTVRVDGVETTKTSVAALSRNVGFVFQNPDHQLFSETVEEEIAFALKNFGYETRCYRKQNYLGAESSWIDTIQENQSFHAQRRRKKTCALASVLAWDPNMLILDEPTIGQDHQQKENLRQFIIQMQAQGKTIVIVTHDVEFVAECNPRVVLMREGTIVADGEGKEILTNPEILAQSSIVLPQIAQVFMQLATLGLPKNIIDLYEAKDMLQKILEKKQAMSVFDGLKFRKVYSPIHNLDPRMKFIFVMRNLRLSHTLLPNPPIACSCSCSQSPSSLSRAFKNNGCAHSAAPLS